MRKTFLLLMAVMVAASMSARKMCIWRDGTKTYELSIQINDSITFGDSSEPKMYIWRNNAQLHELSLQADDSITYVSEFDHEGWREQKTIDIYVHNNHTWQKVNLPWDDVAVTTMPEQYRYPNKEFYTNPKNPKDSVPVWELAFNLCPESTLDGVHMFGLWDARSETMRIYSYLEEEPSANAKYCFYQVTASSPAFMERDAMVWMPSEDVLSKGNWNAAALAGTDAPSMTSSELMPYAGTLDGQINRGWLCADLHLSSGKFKVPENGTINFTLYAVQDISLAGTMDLKAAFSGTNNGTLTIPGNKTKKAAGLWTASGSLFSGIASAVAEGVSVGTQTEMPGLGVAVGVCQGLGAIWTMVGNCKNAYEEGKDKNYTLKMDLDFSGTIKGEFNGQLKSRLSTSVSPVTISYDRFFEGVPKHNSGAKTAPAQANDADGELTFGIWNLKSQPVYYVCKDAMFDNGSLISFLDPTSIELSVNASNQLFDSTQIESIKLVAYDYAFVDESYGLTAQPYYDYYGISQDELPVMGSMTAITGGLPDEDFQLALSATGGKSFTKNNLTFVGIASDSLVEMGLGMYNMVYSPQIRPDQDVYKDQALKLDAISVGIVVEVKFKNGEYRVFSERFLPQIKTFTMAEAQSIIDRLQSTYAPSWLDGYAMPLYGMQKDKALRLLYAAKYPLVPISCKEEYPGHEICQYGVCIRPYQDADHPGIVITTHDEYDPGYRYSCETLAEVYNIVESMGYYETYGSSTDPFAHRLEELDMQQFLYNFIFAKEDKVSYKGSCDNTFYPKIYISIYHVDSNGNVTLFNE